MIQITIDEADPLGQRIVSKACELGRTPETVAMQALQLGADKLPWAIPVEVYLALREQGAFVYKDALSYQKFVDEFARHYQDFLAGDISLTYAARQLGIRVGDMTDILVMLHLPSRKV